MVVKGGAGLPLMDETPDTFVTYTKVCCPRLVLLEPVMLLSLTANPLADIDRQLSHLASSRVLDPVLHSPLLRPPLRHLPALPARLPRRHRLEQCMVHCRLYRRPGRLQSHIQGMGTNRAGYVHRRDCRVHRLWYLARHFRLFHPDFTPSLDLEPADETLKQGSHQRYSRPGCLVSLPIPPKPDPSSTFTKCLESYGGALLKSYPFAKG